MCAALTGAASFERGRARESPVASRAWRSIAPVAGASTGLLGAHAAEDGERVARGGLPDQLPARLDLAVQAGGQGVGVLAGRGADDQEAPVADGPVALVLERLGERVRPLARAQVDAHFPRRVAVVELLLLPRLARWLVVPPLLVLEPAVDPRLAADQLPGAQRLRVRVRVDEDVVAVAGDG